MFAIAGNLHLNTGAKILACLLCVLIVSAQEDTTTNNESSLQPAGSDDGVSTASSTDASASISTSTSDATDKPITDHSIPDLDVSDTITTDTAISSSNIADTMSTDVTVTNPNAEASTDTNEGASSSITTEASTDTNGEASSYITTEDSTDTNGEASESITTEDSTDTNREASDSITTEASTNTDGADSGSITTDASTDTNGADSDSITTGASTDTNGGAAPDSITTDTISNTAVTSTDDMVATTNNTDETVSGSTVEVTTITDKMVPSSSGETTTVTEETVSSSVPNSNFTDTVTVDTTETTTDVLIHLSVKCDPRGTKEQIIEDNKTRSCRCKENVVGDACDQCRPNTFDLQKSHETGCLECYCSGISKNCSLKSYPVTQFTVPIPQVKLLEIRIPNSTIEEGLGIKNSTEITYVSPANESHHELYWSLPSELLSGNQIGSYGNYLNWTQSYESMLSTRADTTPKLVIISTDNTTLTWIDGTPLPPNQSKAFSVQLNEKTLKKENEGVWSSVSREEVLRVLSSIKSILIRAPHSSQSLTVSVSVSHIIMDVVLDNAPPSDPSNPSSSQATLLEFCSCPEGYSGKSCESCAEKYYREKSNNTDLGTCKPCPCNGNEKQCSVSPNSIEIICTCNANFTGRNCEEQIKRPKMIQGPSNTTTPENGEVIFSCKAENTSATNIRWEFSPATNKSTSSNSSTASTIEKRLYKTGDFRQDYKYTIARVSQKDEGWYTCIIFNNMGTVSAKAYLTVTTKTEKESKVEKVATGCLKVATALLCFLCIMVIIPIVLLWILDRRAKKRSKKRMEIAS